MENVHDISGRGDVNTIGQRQTLDVPISFIQKNNTGYVQTAWPDT